MTIAGELVVKITGDDKELQKSLDSSKKRLTKWGKEAKKAALYGAAAFAGAAAIVISKTVEQEKAIAQLESTLKSMGNRTGYTSKQIQGMAKELSNLSTFSDEAIISSQSLLATFGELGSTVFPRANAVIVDMATKMGGDLKSATLQVGKALNAPITGVGALMEVGASFTEEQKKVIKSLVDTGKVAEAQGIILAELEKEFGGSAKAARDTLGGALKSLQNAFGDMLESDNVGGLTTSINDLTKTLSDPKTKEAIGALIMGLLKVVEVAATATEKIVSFTTGLGEFFAQSKGKKLSDFVGEDKDFSHLEKNIKRIERLKEIQKARISDYEQLGTLGTKALEKEYSALSKIIDQYDNAVYLLDVMKKKREQGQIVTNEPGGDGAASKYEEYQKQITALSAKYAEERKAINAQTEGLDYELGLIEVADEIYSAKFEREKEHLESMAQLRKDYANSMIRAEIEKAKIIARSEESMWSNLQSLTGVNAKELFNQIKQSAIDIGLVKAKGAEISSYNAGAAIGGPVVGAAFQAISFARTAQMLSSLRSISSGGSGSGGGSSGGGDTAATTTAAAQQEPTRQIYLNYQGGDYERGIARDILSMIDDQIKLGGTLTGVVMA